MENFVSEYDFYSMFETKEIMKRRKFSFENLTVYTVPLSSPKKIICSLSIETISIAVKLTFSLNSIIGSICSNDR
jgi:hypothetical protein